MCRCEMYASSFYSPSYFPLKTWESITSVRDYCTYMVFIIAQQTDYVGNYYCWTILEKLLLLRESVCRLLVPSRLSAILGAIPIDVLPLLNCLSALFNRFCMMLEVRHTILLRLFPFYLKKCSNIVAVL